MSRLKGAWSTASKSLGSYKIPYTRSLQSEPRNSIELQNGSPATDDNFSSTRREPVSDNDSALEEQIPPPDRKPASRSYTKGWRFGAISCAVSVTIVFFINLGLTIYGSITYTSVLFEGDCGKVETLNTVLHLLINALSTILLSSSNYCMQCLSAPTRSEVDKAHARGIWLDIGIPSVRNLRRISRNRVVLWALLAITSLPLHLFYNSAVFSSLSSYNYHAVSVNQSFVDSEDCVGCNNPAYLRLDELHQKARSGILERLEPADCINQYAQAIQDNRRSVLLVASDDALPPADNNTYGMIQSNPHAYWMSALDARDVFLNNVDAYSWMCPNKSSDLPCSSDINQFKSSPDTWRVGNCYYNHEDCTNKTYPVQYCLSERAEPHCKLQFNLIIAIVCTILNLLKALIMFYVAFRIVENPLITMGDAVASFLEHEDRTTRCIGLTSMKNIRYWSDYQLGPEEWRGGLSRWKDVISRHRWDITIAMFFLAASLLATGTGLSIAGLGTNQKSLPALARLGFGAIRQRLIIFQLLDSATVVQMGSPNNIIPAALAANSPQPALSFIYFTYNGVFTAMLLGWEWCSYSDKRKGLRLSQPPAGEQRSTYFLSLPYRFAFPLMVASGLLHWFTSRALFVIAIDFYGFDGQNASNLKTCGYSPIAMIATLILFVVMILAMVAFGYVPYKRADGMPLAGSCSIAISAACHPEQYIKIEGNPAEQKVKYGVVAESVDGIGHCAFSPKEVKPLEKGKVYAGSGPWCRRRNSPSIVSVYVDDDL